MSEVAALVLRAREGDEAAFGELVRRFQDMAVGFAMARTHDPHRAEDAAPLISEAGDTLAHARGLLTDHQDVLHTGFFHDAAKEYAEARLFAALGSGGAVPGPRDRTSGPGLGRTGLPCLSRRSGLAWSPRPDLNR